MPGYGIRLDATGCIRVSFTEQIGYSHSHSSKVPDFVEEALIELNEDFSIAHPEKKIFSLYKKEGYIYEANTPEEILSVSLAGQDYICSGGLKRIFSSTFTGIFYKKNNKFELLWKAKKYDYEKTPVFLSSKIVERELKKIFNNVELSLGLLSDEKLSYIAWKVTSDEGIFYIPWHNGLLYSDNPKVTFVQKDFQELRKTYKVLRFAKLTGSGNAEYKVI
jgi:hypothetical protein